LDAGYTLENVEFSLIASLKKMQSMAKEPPKTLSFFTRSIAAPPQLAPQVAQQPPLASLNIAEIEQRLSTAEARIAWLKTHKHCTTSLELQAAELRRLLKEAA
jgi:hypothetical protein